MNKIFRATRDIVTEKIYNKMLFHKECNEFRNQIFVDSKQRISNSWSWSQKLSIPVNINLSLINWKKSNIQRKYLTEFYFIRTWMVLIEAYNSYLKQNIDNYWNLDNNKNLDSDSILDNNKNWKVLIRIKFRIYLLMNILTKR